MFYHLCHLLRFFSRLNFFGKFDDGYRLSKGVIFFPVIGLIINLISLGAYFLAKLLGFSNFLQVVMLLAMQIWLTRAMHEDGFCDTVDAISVLADSKKRLAVMKDSHIGGFAVITIIVQLALRTGAIFALSDAGNIVLLITAWCCAGVVAKTAIVWTAWQLELVGEGGLSQNMTGINRRHIFLMLFAVFLVMFVAVFLLQIFWIGLGFLSAISGVYLFNRWVQQKIGGYTGDILGAAEQIAQTIFLVIVSLAV